MDINTVVIAILTALIVAGGNHFWNRRYLLLMEREKYRQALFGEKLKAYRDIADAIHRFSVCVSGIISDFSIPERRDEAIKTINIAYELARQVDVTLDRHVFLIPEPTLDRITFRNIPPGLTTVPENHEPIVEDLTARKFAALDLLTILRDDLGINEFAEKLKK